MAFPKDRSQAISLLKHPLAFNSFLVFGATLLGNLFAYLFNVLAARMLGPSDYGVLASIIAVIGIVSIFSLSVSTVVTKFVSAYKGEGRGAKISVLLLSLTKIFWVLGFLVFLFFFLWRSSLASFFNIPYRDTMILVGLTIFASFLQTVNLGALAGLQKFPFLALVGFSGSFLKFLFGLGLILLGLRVEGAAGGIFLSVLLIYLASLFPLRQIIFQESREKVEWQKLARYSLPVLLTMWGTVSLTNSDVVLVKKFFAPVEAGIYSFVALVGRVILFASASIATVMFPLVSERLAGGRRYRHLLLYVLAATLIISFSLDLFYYLFPIFTIKFFSGFGVSAYVAGSPYVGYLGFYYLLFSLCNTLITYFLSVQKVWVASLLPALAAALQILLISYFHENLWQVIASSLAAVFLLLLGLLLYFFFNDRQV